MTDMIFATSAEPKFAAEALLGVVDSHTCGQSTRVIVQGSGLEAGADPSSARRDLSTGRDWIRRMVIFEPRGHRSMFAAALIAPLQPGGDYGVVFMDAAGYPDMCGHATIGAATTLFELGMLKPETPDFTGVCEFALATPVGRVGLRARLVRGRCESVAFRAPFAYHLTSQDLLLDGAKPVAVDVAYGGQWYAFLPAQAVGLTITPDTIDALIKAAGPVRTLLSQTLTVCDPQTGIVPSVGNIVWTGPAHGSGAHAVNVPISISGSFDRSPCGTATCARMAVLVAQGLLKIGSPFINEGVLGTQYRGTAVETRLIGAVRGIVPEVEGRAWITARSHLYLDDRDPLGNGFIIGDGETFQPLGVRPL